VIPARALAAALEPFAGQVYFSPECHAAYEALGFSPSPGRTAGAVALPDGPAYFTSRGSVLGQVPGEVVAAAFGVFDPGAVVPAVAYGWSLTDAVTIEAARTDGAVAQLRRALGPAPDGADRAVELLGRAVDAVCGAVAGRPLFAGLLAQAVPDDPLAAAWRQADRLREYRGDSHTAAWVSAGFDAVEIGLLTELWWGLPSRSYVRTRAWSRDALDAGVERLRSRRLVDAGDELTAAGREAREAVEVATDAQCQPLVDALGDELDELLSILRPWGSSLREVGAYLPSGPHDLGGGGG
jgi:hypothetical protein